MNAPTGLGIFIWERNQCEGGNLDTIISKCKRCNITWLAVSMGSLSPGDFYKLTHDNGIYVAVWRYVVPGPGETDVFIQLALLEQQRGASAVLPDCEIEWESRKDADGNVHPSDRRAEALTFAQELRKALGPDCWIGNCGAWQWPDRHPIYPDHAFGSQWDAGLPERYWTMFSQTEPASAALDESDKEWADKMNAGAYKVIVPIGSAFDGSGQGGQPLRPIDISNFLDRQETCALWSWQHIPPTIWALLEQRAQARVSTLPPPPAAP